MTNREDLSEKIRREVIAKRFPDMDGASVETFPHVVKGAPGSEEMPESGYEIVFRKSLVAGPGKTYDKTVIVTTDADGKVKRVVRTR